MNFPGISACLESSKNLRQARHAAKYRATCNDKRRSTITARLGLYRSYPRLALNVKRILHVCARSRAKRGSVRSLIVLSTSEQLRKQDSRKSGAKRGSSLFESRERRKRKGKGRRTETRVLSCCTSPSHSRTIRTFGVIFDYAEEDTQGEGSGSGVFQG